MSRALRLLALGALLCVLAGCFAVSSLYVVGVALIVLVAAAELTVRLAARRAHVLLDLEAETVEEGGAVRLAISAGGWRRNSGRPELRTGPAAPWQELPERQRRLELQVTPARRGAHLVGPAALRFSDPFGICSRERASQAGRLLVLPRLERLRRADLERVLGLGRSAPRRDGGSGVGGLRPYRVGAPASRIHWLSVARRGELFERRFEEDADEAAITVVFDTRAPASPEALDMAARATASLCVGLASSGGCALLLGGWPTAYPIRSDLATWPVLHARLALAGEGTELDWRALARARLVVVVGARRLNERSVTEIASCIVSPLPVDAPVLFTVAGCSAQAGGQAAERAA